MSYVGKEVIRQDAVEKVTGQVRYADDYLPVGTLHAVTLRSPIAHGRIVSLKTAAARESEGVRAVFTAADIKGSNLLPLVVDDYPLLADERVRFPGQAVALIAAESRDEAVRAAAKVEVEYEPLDAVFDPLEALEEGAPRVHEPDNVLSRHNVAKGDPDAAFADCDIVMERTYSTAHQVHLYLETQGMVAEPDGRGGILVRGSMQCPYYVLDAVSAATGLPRNKVQIIQAETGGAFGGKEDVPSIVAAHAALLCQATDRPVKLIYEREEDFHSMSKRHPGWARVRYGARKDGQLLACDVRYIVNGGGYTTLSPIVLWRGAVHATGPYDIPNVRVEAIAAATNTVPCGAFRGFGQPQVAFAQESCMDELAAELGMDPAELRRRNMLGEGKRTATNQCLNESCGLPLALDRVLEASQWSKRRDDLASVTKGPIRRGMGVAVGYYGVGLGAGGKHLDRAHAAIQVEADGTVAVAVGNTEMGQGARSALSQIAADALGAPYESVRVRPVDTSRVPDSGPTVASRTTLASGGAIRSAAAKLRHQFEGVAQRLLGEPPEVSEGAFFIKGNEEKSISFKEIVAECYRERQPMQSVGQWVSPDTSFDDDGQGNAYVVYSFSATVVEVEVDIETGEVEVLDLWTAIDVGKAVNPDQVEAQIEGGVLQARGYALTEELILDDGGKILNPNLSAYIIPTTLDAPRIHAYFVEAPYSDGPYGAKGFGEVPMIGTPPAITNAVAHAIGRRPRQAPVTPERLLELLGKKKEELS